MKKLSKISVVVILGISIANCGNLKTKHYKTSASVENLIKKNDTVKVYESDNEKNYSLDFGFNSEEPLVCMLTGFEQAKRKEMLQKEVFSQIKKVEEIEIGYIFYFKYDELFLMRMTDYVLAENNCCPFFTFEIKLHSKNDVSLKITGSKQAKEMIKMALIGSM